jgi:hypothetical protein
MLDAMDRKINEQEALSRFLPLLTKCLKKWVSQRRLYIKKGSSAAQAKTLTKQIFDQLTENNSQQQIQQLQEQITQLQTRIWELEQEKQKKESSNDSNQGIDINSPELERNEIREKRRELERKQKKLENIQQWSSEEEERSSSKSLQLFHSDNGLNEVAKKLEQFDHKQQEKDK